MALSFVGNAVIGFSPLIIDLKLRSKPPASRTATNVQIITGGGQPDLGGNIPHIALWDDNGHRIGQYHAKPKEVLGAADHKDWDIPHSQTNPPNSAANPAYIMLSNLEKNAICIVSIVIKNQIIEGGFLGDTGANCGMSWFLSDMKVGTNFATPKCVWLDADHTNGINARALSFHISDLAPQADKLAQYQRVPDSLCKSTPRFSYWGNLLPDSAPPFFKPPLTYKDDSQGGQGADLDAEAVIDKVVYDKGRYKRSIRESRIERRATSNRDPSHLIVTDYPDHSARELCNHPNSHGWDTVALSEGLFCDMEMKQLYPLCSTVVRKNCFDLDKKSLVADGLRRRDDNISGPIEKLYNSTASWTW